MPNIENKVVSKCQIKLVELQGDLVNQLALRKSEHLERDTGSDDVDASLEVLAEHQFLTTSSRIRAQIVEINYALARIQAGRFGICEETEELIDSLRLLAVPWTRVSLEGAEIREERSKRFA